MRRLKGNRSELVRLRRHLRKDIREARDGIRRDMKDVRRIDRMLKRG